MLLFLFLPGGSEAACPGCTSFGPGVQWGKASPNALTEASGIASSARNPGVLWTHNDGPRGRAYALNTNGQSLANFDINQTVTDVEDIAVGPGPVGEVSYLYVGDIGASGANGGVRSSVKVFRIPEPAISLNGGSSSENFQDVAAFTLTYPDGSYDAEALLVDPITADVLVVTKQEGTARVYRANLNSAANNSTLTLSFVRAVTFGLTSGGDISADGTQIVLRREEFAVVWTRCDNEAVAAALARSFTFIPVIGPPTEPNGEGIALLRDGSGYVTIGEGSDPDIHFFPARCPVAPRFTLSPSNQTVFAGGSVRFEASATGFPAPSYRWRFNGQVLSGQTQSFLALSGLTPAQAGQYEVIASNPSGEVSSFATLTVRAKPDLRITEVEPAPTPGTAPRTGDWWELTSFETQPLQPWRMAFQRQLRRSNGCLCLAGRFSNWATGIHYFR